MPKGRLSQECVHRGSPAAKLLAQLRSFGNGNLLLLCVCLVLNTQHQEEGFLLTSPSADSPAMGMVFPPSFQTVYPLLISFCFSDLLRLFPGDYGRTCLGITHHLEKENRVFCNPSKFLKTVSSYKIKRHVTHFQHAMA